MQFVFDPAKSASNAQKHGIDFEEAQPLWADPDLAILPTASEPELRLIATGRIDDRHWSAIFTLRSGRIRLISVRRSRPSEIEAYEGE